MAGWTEFYVAQLGASAALAGLLFVGLSLNLSKIMSYHMLPDRAEVAFFLLIAVLVVAALFLVPGQPLWLYGAEVLAIGAFMCIFVLRVQVRIYRDTAPEYRRYEVLRFALSLGAVLPYPVAGALLLANNPTGLYWMVPAVIFSILKASSDAWVLLVEINR